MFSAMIAESSFPIVESRAIGWYALGSFYDSFPGFHRMHVVECLHPW